jgi:hypothetical protein
MDLRVRGKVCVGWHADEKGARWKYVRGGTGVFAYGEGGHTHLVKLLDPCDADVNRRAD